MNINNDNQNKYKVSIEICGGLGNQLFQIAAVLHYSKLYGHQAVFRNVIDLPNYTGESRHTYWKYLNGNNNLNLETHISIKNYVTYNEKKFNYDTFEKKNMNVILNGYFQSSKYVDFVRHEMLSLIKSNTNVIQYINQKYSNLIDKDEDLISLHIRRGDYLKLSHYHTNLDMNYYKQALSMVQAKHYLHNMFIPLKVLVFSNDIEWCKENIPPLDPKLHFIFISDEDYVEMLLMSKCKYNIIANSSFSWWASYINEHKDKFVIAPKKWFGKSGPNNWDDIYASYMNII